MLNEYGLVIVQIRGFPRLLNAKDLIM